MSYKFFYLFLVGGVLGLMILIYQVMTQYPKLETIDAVFNAILVVVFFYMAYKVRREKEDKDLM
jgi:Ca2+/Na+ antiporter